MLRHSKYRGKNSDPDYCSYSVLLMVPRQITGGPDKVLSLSKDADINPEGTGDLYEN